MSAKPEPNPFEINPIHKAKMYEEKIVKEQKCYKKWQKEDHLRTGGYLG